MTKYQYILYIISLLLMKSAYSLITNSDVVILPNTLASIMDFGFLKDGTIDQTISMKSYLTDDIDDHNTVPYSYIYYFVCDAETKKKLWEARNDEICENTHLTEKTKNCLLKYMIYLNNTNLLILPIIDKNIESIQERMKYVIDNYNMNSEMNALIEEIYTGSKLEDISYKKIQYTVDKNDIHWFIALNCFDYYTNLKIDSILMNPGGEHLSSGEIKNKLIYFIMIALWSFLSLIWLFRLAVNYCYKMSTNQLTYFGIIAGFLWTTFVILEQRYWYLYSNTGEPNKILDMTSTAILSISDSVTIIIFILLAKGYNIINIKLLAKDKREIVIIVLFRMVILWLYKLLGDFVLIIFGLLDLALLILIYRDIAKCLKKTQKKLDNLDANIYESTLYINLKKKIQILRFYRLMILFYFISVSFSKIAGIFLFMNQPWIETLLSQILLLFVFYVYSLCFNLPSLKNDFHLVRILSDEDNDDLDESNNNGQNSRKIDINQNRFLKIVQNIVFINHPFHEEGLVILGSEVNNNNLKADNDDKDIKQSINTKKIKIKKKHAKYLECTTITNNGYKESQVIVNNNTECENIFKRERSKSEDRKDELKNDDSRFKNSSDIRKILFPPPKITVIDMRTKNKENINDEQDKLKDRNNKLLVKEKNSSKQNNSNSGIISQIESNENQEIISSDSKSIIIDRDNEEEHKEHIEDREQQIDNFSVSIENYNKDINFKLEQAIEQDSQLNDKNKQTSIDSLHLSKSHLTNEINHIENDKIIEKSSNEKY